MPGANDPRRGFGALVALAWVDGEAHTTTQEEDWVIVPYGTVFPSPPYDTKQPRDPVVPKLPCTGILVGPSKSGKTVALISMILDQYRGCFERIYVFSPSINVDDGWRPVKKYIEETMKIDTTREQVYFEDWDEAALRQIIRQQRKITETSKQLKMKQLYQILILIDDFADSPHLHKKSGDAALDSLLEELTALAPKQELHAMYEEALLGRRSNFAAATYVESTNEITVAWDGNRTILNDQELRNFFPSGASYPAGATPTSNHIAIPPLQATDLDGNMVNLPDTSISFG
ncbi:unnamed protein product [Symbiodinium sp. KB8]|nr:unnamed protein product [Symbiodinium sp. KB8]